MLRKRENTDVEHFMEWKNLWFKLRNCPWNSESLNIKEEEVAEAAGYKW